MALVDFDDFTPEAGGPLDVCEQVLQYADWAYERSGNEELTAAVQGSWCTYQLRLVWREDESSLQLVSLFDLRVSEFYRATIYETLGLINERLWLGHFEMWAGSGEILFRHATLIDRDSGLAGSLAESLIEAAVAECERFYPVFQFVLWAGKKPQEALQAAMLETVGEA